MITENVRRENISSLWATVEIDSYARKPAECMRGYGEHLIICAFKRLRDSALETSLHFHLETTSLYRQYGSVSPITKCGMCVSRLINTVYANVNHRSVFVVSSL
jgi:hypothetical protein